MDNTPIYLKIAEALIARIWDGEFPEGGRLPSVREFAAENQVNANTAMRSYAYLQEKGVARQERGVGYFVADDARKTIRQMRADAFYKEEVFYFFQRFKELGKTPDDVRDFYQQWLNKN